MSPEVAAIPISGGGTFQPNPEHTYTTAAGVRVPSVTEAIGDAGLGVDLGDAPQWAIDQAGQRGTFLHRAIHFALEGTLSWNTVDPEHRPVVKVALRRLKEAKFEPLRLEEPGICERYHYGYTIDLEGMLYGADSIVDIKSGSTVPVGPCGLQLSAYAIGRRERAKLDRSPKRYVLRLFVDQGDARLIPVPTDPFEDEADFLSAVRCWYRRQRGELLKEMR